MDVWMYSTLLWRGRGIAGGGGGCCRVAGGWGMGMGDGDGDRRVGVCRVCGGDVMDMRVCVRACVSE